MRVEPKVMDCRRHSGLPAMKSVVTASRARVEAMPTVCTLEEAVALIRPVDRIGFGLGPAIPDALLTALGTRDDWEDLQIGGALCLNLYDVFTKPGVSYRCGFFGPAERLHHSLGHRVELVPGGFRQMGPIMARFAPRVMVAQAAPPDEHGHREPVPARGRNAGRAAPRPDGTPTGCSSSRSTRTCPAPGACRPTTTTPSRSELIDVLVESDGDPFALADPPTTEVDAAIARHALAYVQDGSTLQTGIGAIPNIVAAELARGPLGGFGVHSEMFTTGLMRLHQAGQGHQRRQGDLRRRVGDDLRVGRRPSSTDGSTGTTRWPSSPSTRSTTRRSSARNANLVSINGALSVDLYGQVMADSIDGRQISGVGGHEDFVAGAELHLDAHSLICLRSTAVRDGEVVSRIAGIPPEGSVVSTPRHHTGVVITEYGAAELTGRTVRERAHLLVDIAHPDFRRDLRKAADGLGRA